MLEQQEPEEMSVYATYSTVGFAGTLGLRSAHCFNFPEQAAHKKYELVLRSRQLLIKRYNLLCIIQLNFMVRMTSPLNMVKDHNPPGSWWIV